MYTVWMCKILFLELGYVSLIALTTVNNVVRGGRGGRRGLECCEYIGGRSANVSVLVQYRLRS